MLPFPVVAGVLYIAAARPWPHELSSSVGGGGGAPAPSATLRIGATDAINAGRLIISSALYGEKDEAADS